MMVKKAAKLADVNQRPHGSGVISAYMHFKPEFLLKSLSKSLCGTIILELAEFSSESFDPSTINGYAQVARPFIETAILQFIFLNRTLFSYQKTSALLILSK